MPRIDSHCLLMLMATMMMTTASCQNHQPVPQPEVKRNPQPQEKYLVRMVIQGAPRPFDKVEGKVQYDIPEDDDACVPRDYTIAPGGIRINPSEDVPIAYRKISETEYEAEVFLDALLDEDYYGLGICRWRLTAVAAFLTSGDVTFWTSTHLDYMQSGKTEVTYTANAFFDEQPVLGDSHSMLRAGVHSPRVDKDFTISFTSRRVVP